MRQYLTGFVSARQVFILTVIYFVYQQTYVWNLVINNQKCKP